MTPTPRKFSCYLYRKRYTVVSNYRQVTELQRSLNVKNAILLVTLTDNYSSQVLRLSKSTTAANISRN